MRVQKKKLLPIKLKTVYTTGHIVFTNCFCIDHSEQFMCTTCSELGIFIYCTCNSMNNLLPYHELVDARISASEKDLPVPGELLTFLLINMDFFFVPCSNDPKFKLWGPREPS